MFFIAIKNVDTEPEEWAEQRMTQAASLEEAVRGVGGTWDTQRSVAALAEAGHEATDKRACQILRDLAAVGLLVKAEPGQAVYSAVEQ